MVPTYAGAQVRAPSFFCGAPWGQIGVESSEVAHLRGSRIKGNVATGWGESGGIGGHGSSPKQPILKKGRDGKCMPEKSGRRWHQWIIVQKKGAQCMENMLTRWTRVRRGSAIWPEAANWVIGSQITCDRGIPDELIVLLKPQCSVY